MTACWTMHMLTGIIVIDELQTIWTGSSCWHSHKVTLVVFVRSLFDGTLFQHFVNITRWTSIIAAHCKPSSLPFACTQKTPIASIARYTIHSKLSEIGWSLTVVAAVRTLLGFRCISLRKLVCKEEVFVIGHICHFRRDLEIKHSIAFRNWTPDLPLILVLGHHRFDDVPHGRRIKAVTARHFGGIFFVLEEHTVILVRDHLLDLVVAFIQPAFALTLHDLRSSQSCRAADHLGGHCHDGHFTRHSDRP
mmetsp:Transcript_71121/g.113024  ORF Transcript_71121/g.113024 Transcript_71121/m.113024 type:complete len:249 (+) Transcript_71121:277-1023(+)